MELSAMRGIGPTRLEALRAVGIVSLRDLLYCLPVRYEDRTQATPCSLVKPGEALVEGIITEKPKFSAFGGPLPLIHSAILLRNQPHSTEIR